MSETIKVFRISIANDPISSSINLPTLEALKDELDNLFDGWEHPLSGGTYQIELLEMDKAEFEALPEWDGF